VNQALQSTLKAAGTAGDKRVGVVWHTQGSGKSLTMAFYAGRVVLHYTKQDDGLKRIWRGRVYLNPPYGREIRSWILKLHDAYQAGSVCEAIALLPARTDTQWFRILRPYPKCFLTGRLKFGEARNSAPFPCTL